MAESIRVTSVEPFTRWMETRFPFRYGIASMTRLPHLFLRVTIEVGDRQSIGICSEGLPPKWFTKDPTTTFEEDLPDLVGVIKAAAESSLSLDPQPSLFDWWRTLYKTQDRNVRANGVPPLLAFLGVSLLERGVIDAYCRHREAPFHRLLIDNDFGIRLGEIHPELEGDTPADYLPADPSPAIGARHTVGLGDALSHEDIPEEDLAGDSLPQALDDCIQSYGLRYFKIKLSGKLDVDRQRLAQLVPLLEKGNPEYEATLDGNEQFPDIETFRSHWETLSNDPEISGLLKPPHLLFVEQPLHRDASKTSEVPRVPPCIIDESDSTLESLRLALQLGYRGTSHKNCKGVIKGIANACLLEHLRRNNPGETYLLSGEDLANVGPVTLLQDLAVMASLGLEHVERNGHHYFKGMSMFPGEIQQELLQKHGDLYREEGDFATLAIESGKVSLNSVLQAPFGTAIDPTDKTCALLGTPGWPV